MPRFPVIQTQVADPARAAQYSAPDVAPVQPQEPQQMQQLGQAMEQAGQQFSALAADRERRINLAAHTEREAAAKEIEIAKFSEFGRLEGKAAVDGFDSYMKEMEKRHEAAIRSAPAGPQRDWLQQSLRQQRVQLLNSATSHRDKELRTWRIGGASASLQQSIKTAIAMHGSPDDDSNAQDVADKARELAALQGASDEQTNMLVAQGISDMHVGRFDKLLADPGRTAEAAAYLAAHKNEISQESYEKSEKVAKAAVIEGTARELTSRFYRFDDRMKWVDEKFQGSADDKESLRRHLMQQQELRDRADAQVAQEVRKEAMQFYRDNPNVDPRDADPELAERMDRYNVVVKRVPVTDDAWVQANLRDPRKLAELRAMTPEQRENILAPHLSESDLKKELAFIDGDQHAYSKAEMFDRAAVALGVPLSTAYQGEEAKTAAAQARMRFDAMMNREIELRRSKKGADLSLTEIQKEIIDPMLMARNYVAKGDWSPERMPLAEAQVRGLMPTSIDDPATEVDESQSFEGAGDFYVETPTARVYLRDITLQQRREIALSWARKFPGRQMTLQDEADAWVDQYKPAVDAKKAVEARGSSGSMIPGRDQRGVPPMGPK